MAAINKKPHSSTQNKAFRSKHLRKGVKTFRVRPVDLLPTTKVRLKPRKKMVRH